MRWGARPGVHTKPDPAGVYSLMADLGADPQSTLFVGDSDADILTDMFGLPALGVLWGFRAEAEPTAAGADALAAKPEEGSIIPPAIKCRSTDPAGTLEMTLAGP